MLNKTLTLTIVIPVFNEQDHIAACLEAIAAQTVVPDEVIVVDNNSTDRTAKIVKNYRFAQLVKENRQGIVFARNTGFNLAKSSLIARIDADTLLPAGWAQQLMELYAAAGAPALYAATGPSVFRNRFSRIWYAMHRLTYFWPSRLLLGHNTLVGSNMFLTRQLWGRVRPSVCLDTAMHEDMDLAHHIYLQGVKVNFVRQFRATILGRRMLSRVYSYPMMMLRVRSAAHF